MIVEAFDPELERRDRPGIERTRKPRGKIAPRLERRNQVKLARHGAAIVKHLAALGERRVYLNRGSNIPTRFW